MTLRMEAMIPTWLWRSWEMWLLSAFYHRLVKVAIFKNLLFLNVQDPDFGSVCVSGEEGRKGLGSLWAGIWVHVEFWWHAELLKELLNRNIWFKGHFLVCVGSAGITAQFAEAWVRHESKPPVSLCCPNQERMKMRSWMKWCRRPGNTTGSANYCEIPCRASAGMVRIPALPLGMWKRGKLWK